MRLFYLILIIGCSLTSKSQNTEIKEFEQNKTKTFNSKGLEKSRGLDFTIKYPGSYLLTDVKNVNVIKGFYNPNHSLIYMVGVVKTESFWSKSDKENLFSKKNMEQSVSSSTNGYTFLSHKKDIKANGLDAAYIEYKTKVGDNVNSYFRQYFIVYKNYLVTINFAVLEQPNSDDQTTKNKFVAYEKFFDSITQTLNIIEQ